MTGILIVTHANLGETLIETVEFILGKKMRMCYVKLLQVQETVSPSYENYFINTLPNKKLY